MSQAYLQNQADGIGPEAMVYVHDAETGMKGLLVVDNSTLGPPGGGVRMLPDITAEEIAGLARAMTYKFGIYGFPRGGAKGGIWGDPAMPDSDKTNVMKAFGRQLRPYLGARIVAVGPDMGVGIQDLTAIYEGAGAYYPRTGLFEQVLEEDPLEFHLTGFGVIVAARSAFEVACSALRGATVAIEGFGHVGVGVARYAIREGAVVVAVSTVHGAIYDPNGLDVARLIDLRRQFGDRCLAEYPDADSIPKGELFFLPVDLLVPGARPHVITEQNVESVQAKFISSGGNIPVTEGAEDRLFQRGVLCVPDFIANGGGVIASMVDYLGGTMEQGFQATENMIERITGEILREALGKNRTPRHVATGRVMAMVEAERHRPRKSWEQVSEEIRGRLGVF